MPILRLPLLMDKGNEYGILLDEDRESFSSVVFMVEVGGVVEVFIVNCVCFVLAFVFLMCGYDTSILLSYFDDVSKDFVIIREYNNVVE